VYVPLWGDHFSLLNFRSQFELPVMEVQAGTYSLGESNGLAVCFALPNLSRFSGVRNKTIIEGVITYPIAVAIVIVASYHARRISDS